MGQNLYLELEKNYPSKVGKYVVSSSLLKPDMPDDPGNIFAKMMADYIGDISKKGDLKSLTFESKNISIINALKFLQKIIENERKKETLFISYIQKETGKTSPSTAEDWKDYVLSFQEELQIGNQNLKILQNEYETLKSNTTASHRTTIKEDKIKHHYDRAILEITEYTKDALNSVVNFLKGDFRYTKGKVIISYILQKYGADLIQLDIGENKSKVTLNPSQVSSLMVGISQILIEAFFTNRLNNFFKNPEGTFNKDLTHNFSNEMEQILQNDQIIDEQIKNMITKAKQLPFITDNISRNYKIPEKTSFDEKKFSSIASNFQESDNIIETANKELRNVVSLFNGIDFQPTIELISNQANLAELSSSLKQVIIGGLSLNTGASKAKPDNIIAKIVIKPPEDPRQIRIVNKTLELINQKMLTLSNTLKQTNTVEYYKEQNKNWAKTADGIEKLLNYLKEKYDILGHCFLIEDSTKNYTSLETPGDLKHGFEGGSLGANISDQIGKIAALQNGYLITTDEANWLITAAINCGANLIGAHIKESLENYLSAFATILLFDDQQQIANEITDNYIKNIDNSQTSVTRLHLFSLNNGYYPLSFVLQLTYEKLMKLYGLLDSELNPNTGNHGAKVTISGFIDPDNYYPPNKKNNLEINSWESLSQVAQNNVKMSVIFLSNFASLVSSLLGESWE